MSIRTRLLRLLAGFGLMIVVLVVSFAVLIPAIHRWGATDAELARAMPGDDLLSRPIIHWTHGVTIDAPPEKVWPWIVQMGDTRAGFYSYTFIENRLGGLIGGPGYDVVYHNADRIVPEWQHPSSGDHIIQGGLLIREVQPGEWFLAESVDPEAIGWVWVWAIYPHAGGEQTRMVVRMRIQPPPGPDNPALEFFMDIGGFVMEQNMLQGLKLRAEGGSEPAYIETVEILVWLAALMCGLTAAALFLWQRAWVAPLTVGVASILVLMVLTFVQPPIWVRILLDGLLLVGVWWSWRSGGLNRQVTEEN